MDCGWVQVLMIAVGVYGSCGWVRVLMVAFVLMFAVVGVDGKKNS